MTLRKLDGAFPIAWWQITDTTEDIYDGAFPVLLGPSSKVDGVSTLGHTIRVALDSVSQMGHRFSVPPKTMLMRDVSRVTRNRLR